MTRVNPHSFVLMRHLLQLLLVMATLTAQAQQFERYARYYINERDLEDTVAVLTARQWEVHTGKHSITPMSKTLLDKTQEHVWTDGINIYSSWYDTDEQVVSFIIQPDIYPVEECDQYAPFTVRKGQVWANGVKQGTRVTTEQVAGRVMLVMRDAQGKPFKTFYHLDYDHEYQGGLWTLLLPQLFNGNYTTPAGENAIFGPRQEHYTGSKYSHDPGVFNGYRFIPGKRQINILYGSGRVSGGDPSDPKWGKMPGGGGAAAIMGPMEWVITPTLDGLQAKVLHDEPFVEHMPPIGKSGDTVQLTMVQQPFNDLPGKWAFASVFPLTHKMLELYPKEVLTLMRGEIYARHGDTFKDPATQRYFNAQPWYIKTGKPVKLTDVERFNYQLIKQVEFTR